ncbi:ATP-binding cassette domain-containing protein [Microbacterium marinum]|uniref:ABC transporter ATP-binding protein n=1 Tax=Microbacterium marinum TaxID=421115 RepID=UPI0038516086
MTDDPIIRVENLSFRYPGATEDTLRNVSISIHRGDFVAVVGGNGAAKTTLCKTFNGLIPHYWAGEFAGSVHVDGVDTYTSSVADLSTTVGYVYQDFQNQLVRPTVSDEVAFGPLNFGWDDHAERAQAALGALGIGDLGGRFIWQLSGGQAHLTALAGAVALAPAVIIVDEPVAELDPARAEEIYERLTFLNREHGTTVITIEHHAEFIARYAKTVLLMAHGTPVWHLPVEEALLRSAELEEHGIPAPQPVSALHRLGIRSAPRTPEEAADVLRAHDVHVDGAAVVVASDRAAERVVAHIEGVSHGYRSVGGGITPVLEDLDLTVYEGDRVALVGGNGAGKSTLMKLLAGITVARTGEVTVEGRNTRAVSARRMAETVAYLPQHPETMFLRSSVREDVALTPRTRRAPDADRIVEQVLARVRLEELADRDGRMLSGGQQRRAALAIGLAMRPRLLLLDEPTASLDVRSRDDVTAMLAELADTISCAIVATHDMQLVAEWANRVIVLEGGRVRADLTPRELFAHPELARTLRPPHITRLGTLLRVDPVPLSVDEFVAAVSVPVRTAVA